MKREPEPRIEWPLWMRTLAWFGIGWATTFVAIYADAYGYLSRRYELLILVGPGFTVVAVVLAIRELWARHKQAKR